MKSYLHRFALLFLLVAPLAHAAGFDRNYKVRTGDLNSDGRTDIYLQHHPRLIPVRIDPLTMIPIHSEVDDFVMQQNAQGEFDLVTSLSSTQKTVINQWSLQSAIEIIRKDYNTDGLIDIMLSGVGSVISGAKDVIVFAPTTKGAPPSVAKNINASVDQFVTDVNGWLEDPNYFSSGVSVECGIQYFWVLYYLGDGYYEWRYEPYYVCQYVFDPSGFSNTALNFLNNFSPVLDEGKIVAQSTAATNISQILQQFFGVSFFKGALQSGGEGGDSSECSLVNGCVDYERLARLADVLRDWAARFGDCTHNVAHHYSLDTQICSSGTNCTSTNVYKEQLTHPAPGYLTNNNPVADGQTGFAELGIPGPLDDGGPIVFHVNKPSLWHQNETIAGHLFHPGTVTRQTHVNGSAILISTVGDGTGACKRLNEIVGVSGFKAVDLVIAAHVSLGKTAQHSAIP